MEDELVHDSMDDVPRVRIMSAAEPFTTSDNLQYEPLNDFLDIVVRESPDIVILMGPFVDNRHRMMNPSTLPVPYEDIFDIRLMRRILKAAESTTWHGRYKVCIGTISGGRALHLCCTAACLQSDSREHFDN